MLTHMTMRTTISMPDDIWAQVEAQQSATGASVSEIVRRALTAYFAKASGNGKPKATKTVTRKGATPVKRATKRVVKA
jgi:metal-responsive CopG/Arc/MetJ family transcriptional regulator